MEVQTIEMDPAEAKRLYGEYRVAVKARHLAEDKAISQAYLAISKGKRVLNMFDVMKAQGMTHNWEPRIAICRADAKDVWFTWRWGCWVFSMERFPTEFVTRKFWTFPQDTFDGVDPDMITELKLHAPVPPIPPKFRPRGRLDRYHLLWEPVWDKKAPKDPILLRTIKWPVFAVVAQWDMTKVERSIFEGSM